MKYKIYNQDVVEWSKSYEKQKFHALLSDAPYELNFMGQKWDRSGVAFRPETWEALGEHLYPGAFGMCFSASRNWHRLAVAIEDAGMIIHPTIFGWLNGQGFPKATNISKKLDYHDGSQTWIGHRYGLQALKPAVEPIIVFQKPYEGKPLDNIVETGAGALNIDDGRIPVDAPVTINRFTNGAKPWGDAKGEEFDTVSTSQGRWPSNFVLDESSAELLDAQTGTLTSGKPSGVRHAKNHIYGQYGTGLPVEGIGDSGGASRFFFNVQEQIDEADPIYYCGKVSPKERNAGLDELPLVDNASSDYGTKKQNLTRKDGGKNIVNPVRCNHPTMKPIALAKYLATLLLPPEEYAPRRILVPFSGVASEMIGCALAGWEHIVGIEFDTENGYVDIAHKRMEYWTSK